MLDLFGNLVNEDTAKHVNIYADEIQEVKNIITKERWIYTGAIYELRDKPLIEDLVYYRYRKDQPDWQNYVGNNNLIIHWSDLGNNNKSKHIVNRWLNYVLEDCKPEKRKFHFSVCGINLTNLQLGEFGDKGIFNNIYNRFFRSMLCYSLKKFFSTGVVVDHIYHEEGQQANHGYFDWHTVYKLDQDERINLLCNRVEFLPKNHRLNPKSNATQLCDVLLGIFKDIHLGFHQKTYSKNKKDILDTNFVKELIIRRVIRDPKRYNSSYGHAKRFQISLFPRIKSKPDSFQRLMNNYYDTVKLDLGYEHNYDQMSLGF